MVLKYLDRARSGVYNSNQSPPFLSLIFDLDERQLGGATFAPSVIPDLTAGLSIPTWSAGATIGTWWGYQAVHGDIVALVRGTDGSLWGAETTGTAITTGGSEPNWSSYSGTPFTDNNYTWYPADAASLAAPQPWQALETFALSVSFIVEDGVLWVSYPGGILTTGSTRPDFESEARGGNYASDPEVAMYWWPLGVVDVAALDASVGKTMLVWPDQSGHGRNAVVTTTETGFVTFVSNSHTTVTAVYGSDSGLTVSADLSGECTLYYLVTVGADVRTDGQEMCPLTWDPVTAQQYNDWYIHGGDRSTSRMVWYKDGDALRGGPQPGDTLVVTQSYAGSGVSPALGAAHVDGFSGTGFSSGIPGNTVAMTGTDNPATSGVLIANFPGGGYCAAGRWRRVLCYSGLHNAAQRRAVRVMLRAQAGEDGIDVVAAEPDFDP